MFDHFPVAVETKDVNARPVSVFVGGPHLVAMKNHKLAFSDHPLVQRLRAARQQLLTGADMGRQPLRGMVKRGATRRVRRDLAEVSTIEASSMLAPTHFYDHNDHTFTARLLPRTL